MIDHHILIREKKIATVFKLNQISSQILLLAMTGAAAASSIYAKEHHLDPNPGFISQEPTVKDDAQPKATEEVAQLAELVVTARRREEKAQDVPTAISILAAQTLETQRLSRLEDLQQALPSLNVAFINPRQSSVAVRGIGNNPASDGLEASVGVYLDNVYLGRPGMAVFDLLDVAQLELLRGPQGTLFGKNTTAGLLNISSKLPTFYPDHSAEVSFGTRNYLQHKLSFSNAINDQLAGRLSFYRSAQDGFIYNLHDRQELNDTDRFGFRGQLLWEPAPQVSVRWIAEYNKEDDHQGMMVMYYPGPTFTSSSYGENYNRYYDNATQSGAQNLDLTWRDRKVNSDAAQQMIVEQGGTSAEINWDLDNDYKLTSISAYRFWNFSPANSDYISSSAAIDGGVNVKDKQYSQEIRLASPSNQPIDWVAGLYYFQQNLKNETFTLYGDQADALYLYNVASLRSLIAAGDSNIYNNRSSFSYGTADTQSSAIFAQANWHATPKLDFSAGGRLTYEDKEARVYRLAPVGGSAVSDATALERAYINSQLGAYDSGLLTQHGLSYSSLFTTSYRFNPTTLAYLTFSHGEKSGGFNLAVGSAPTAGADSLKIDPEKANNYEIGLKQTLFNQKLQLNTNLFWIDVSDYQTNTYTLVGSSTVSILTNAGKVRSRGFEIDATLQPIQRLRINVNGALNDTRYTEYYNAPAPSNISIPTGVNTQDLSGQRVYAVPRWTANLNFRYDFKEIENWQPYFSGSYSWRDWAYGTLDNNPGSIIDAYTLVNVSVGTRKTFADNEVDFSFWVKNLNDRIYVTNTWSSTNGTVLAGLGQPRTVGATLKLRF
jgi:iron complex outermembrane receptor protein